MAVPITGTCKIYFQFLFNMTHELESCEKLKDEEFKIQLQEIQPYVTAIKWTNCGTFCLF